VQNLSQTGVGFSCQGNLTERLRESAMLRNCSLTIPGAPDIACDLEARSFEFRKQPHRHTIVGARMDNLAPAAAKQLEQFVLLTQRQQRRESVRS
jgi:c-di-GMP-binding flagellar brake protein YcgR